MTNLWSRKHAAVMAAAAFCAAAVAQGTYPSHPVQLVVINSPGTTTDMVARAISDKLGQRLGAPVIVTNKTGGGGVIASDFVAKSAPDGYTFLVTNSALAANQFLYRKLPYDTVRDFVPVGLVGESPYLVIVNAQLGAKTMPEFIAYARKNPGKVNYASGGVGSGTHLTCALLAAKAGIQLTHIPYSQASAINTDLMANMVQLMCAPTPSAGQIIREGKTYVLGSSGLEDVSSPYPARSIAKAARIDFQSTNWNGLFAPAGTPAPVLAKFEKALAETLQDPEVQQRFQVMGMTPRPLIGSPFNAFFRDEIAKWGPVVKASGATLD